ncbi:2-succinyl-6-hydroxy-2,4-cyclohexadiene-1-carboxylate synthase [Bacillus timonensis]|nr:2-succinyl-6-hydroxy-2,4-cyclohexadiene-1-carboxylate synthase [Bacillus timonensis]
MFIQTTNCKYHVRVVGNGMPFVMLHGFTSSIETWSELLPQWQKKFQCILIDVIGHGNTDSPLELEKYSIEVVIEDIYQILKKLQVRKANFLGYSMGGRIALGFAVRYPDSVNKLILESSSPGLMTEEDRLTRRMADQKLAAFIEEEGIEKFVDYWEKIPLFHSQQNLTMKKRLAVREERLKNNPLGLGNSLRGMGTGSQPSYWDALRTLPIETLLICGEYDKKFCDIANLMHQRLKRGKVIKINGVGHAIHVEQTQIFGKIVSEFLQVP